MRLTSPLANLLDHYILAFSYEHPGEVAKLIQALASRMDKQGSAPYKSAEMAKLICEQYGIRLPVDFVKVPEYEQISLFGNAD